MDHLQPPKWSVLKAKVVEAIEKPWKKITSVDELRDLFTREPGKFSITEQNMLLSHALGDDKKGGPAFSITRNPSNVVRVATELGLPVGAPEAELAESYLAGIIEGMKFAMDRMRLRI